LRTFTSLGLCQPVLDAVTKAGYEHPTPIQERSIPAVLEGSDVLGLAQTGTGKTAAFCLPVLHRLMEMAPDKKRRGTAGPRALVLAPTRELATQIAESMREYGVNTGLRGCVIFGGVRQFPQVRNLRNGVDIVVATPGRLMDLMDQGHVDLSNIRVLVLDEADRMLDMGFIHPIRKICSHLPEQRQSLLFSATMPKSISQLAGSLLRDPVQVRVDPKKQAELKIEQSLHFVDGQDKADLLRALLDDEAVRRAVVFTKTKHGADNLAKKLHKSGIRTESIHGNKSQAQRTRALDGFRAGHAPVLVATDVAARGLDVDGITHVFNFNLPNEPEAYVHRIGRTGRAGAAGAAVSFCDRSERGFLRDIERHLGKQIGLASGEPRAPERPQRKARPKDADRPYANQRKRSKNGDRPGPSASRSGKNARRTKRSRSPHA
jgi:ATP-dependent RNA helicase RhlE